jgi:hypothetical protein
MYKTVQDFLTIHLNKEKKHDKAQKPIEQETEDSVPDSTEIPINPLAELPKRQSTSPLRKRTMSRPPEGVSSVHGGRRNPLASSASDAAALGFMNPATNLMNMGRRGQINNSYSPFDGDKYNGCVIAEGIREKIHQLLNSPRHEKMISKMKAEIERQ